MKIYIEEHDLILNLKGWSCISRANINEESGGQFTIEFKFIKESRNRKIYYSNAQKRDKEFSKILGRIIHKHD